MGLTFVSHGLRLGVRVNDPALLPEIRRRLPVGARERENGVVDHLFSVRRGGDGARRGLRHFHLLYCNEGRLARTDAVENLLADVEGYLEEMVVIGAPGRLFLHAGVVGWRGRAIVLPGKSGAGKTTLVAALLRRGATYFSDEYAVLDEQGRVHPYPRPLHVRAKEGVVETTAAALGAHTGVRRLPVGLVLLTSYRAQGRWRVARVPEGRAALELLRHAPAARLMPREALLALTRLAVRAPVWTGSRGEADEACEQLLDLLARSCDNSGHASASTTRA